MSAHLVLVQGLAVAVGAVGVAWIAFRHISGKTARLVAHVEQQYGQQSEAAAAARKLLSRERMFVVGWMLVATGLGVGVGAALLSLAEWLVGVAAVVLVSGAFLGIAMYVAMSGAWRDIEARIGADGMRRLYGSQDG